MAGLGDLLGGYGSDEDEEMEEGEAPSEPDQGATGAVRILTDASPAASNLSNEEDKLANMPHHVISGPVANPEPPPEGLSPPIHTGATESGAEGQETDPSQNPIYILPPELREPPPGEPDPALEEKVTHMLNVYYQTGKTVMDQLKKIRAWNNPDFLEKMVDHFQLQQYGSCFPKEVWDPENLPPEDTWKELQQQLAVAEERKAAERKAGVVAFQSGGTLPAAVTAGGLAAGAGLPLGSAPKTIGGMGGRAGGMAGSGTGSGLDLKKLEEAKAQAAAKAAEVAAKQRRGSKWDSAGR